MHRNSPVFTRPRSGRRRSALVACALVVLSCITPALGQRRVAPAAKASNANGSQLTDFADIPDAGKREILALVAEKESRSPAMAKVDSKLIQALYESQGRAMAQGVTHLDPIALEKADNGLPTFDLRAHVTPALLDELSIRGVEIASSFPEYDTIRVVASLDLLEEIASLPDVLFVEPARQAHTNRIAAPAPSGPAASRAERTRLQLMTLLAQVSADKVAAGAVTSEGDRTHRADDARNGYGFTGAGIRIGVLSDSFNNLGGASADVAAGELPGPGNPFGNTTAVTVVDELPSGGADEGRAMLQVIHDVAPQAQLYFATAFNSEASFAANILALRNAPNNCDIIIDDVGYFDESPFQDGIVAQSVNTVTASGALYFSSAGNSGAKAKNTSSVYEADFLDGGTLTISGNTKTGRVHNFGTVATPVQSNQVTVSASGIPYNLFWSDPLGASSNDYDLFIMNSTLTTVRSSSTNVQNGTQDPFEQPGRAVTSGDRIVIFKTTAAADRALHLDVNGGGISVNTNGQTRGHACAVDAYNVAATPAAAAIGSGQPVGPYPGAFTSSNLVETYSSDGPRRVFYNANGTAITPGNLLFGSNGGAIRNKPDITAADGVATTLPASTGLNPFYGTSCAAPHAGAIAALLKSADPLLTPAQIRSILTSTALDIEGAGYDVNSGAGVLQAFQAMQTLAPTPRPVITLGTVTTAEGCPNNGNGTLDPGEAATLSIPLRNPSLATATNVQASLALTSATPGVTIVTNGNVGFGTIAPSGGMVSQPFTIALTNAVPAGAKIDFTLTATFDDGSPTLLAFSVRVGKKIAPISSILDTTPPPAGTGYTAITGSQTGRLNRNGVTSTCASPKAAPPLQTATGARQFDAYTFTNTAATSQCVTVTITSPCNASVALFAAAYTSAGYVPSSPATNYLADTGVANALPAFSFTVAAGAQFTVVLHEVNTGGGANCSYTLDVDLYSIDPVTPLPGAPTAGSNGTICAGGSIFLTASAVAGATGYAWSGPNGFTSNQQNPVISNATPDATGTYSVVAMIGSCATAAATTDVTVNAIPATPTAGNNGPVCAGSMLALSASGPANATYSWTGPNGFTSSQQNPTIASATEADSGDYFVTVTVSGCPSPAAMTSVVVSAPFTASADNTGPYCPGSMVELSAATTASGASFAWTGPNGFTSNQQNPVIVGATAGATGTYTVTVSAGGCVAMATTDVTVSDTAPPTIDCPANMFAIATQTDGSTVSFATPNAVDGCSTPSVACTPSAGSVFPVGTTTVTCTATDASNNTANCSFTVTVAMPKDSVAIYLPGVNGWFLRNVHGGGPADAAFTFGGQPFTGIVGDWNGDGVDTPGLYDAATGAFFLRNSSTPGPADLMFTFGAGGQGYVPIVGDWNNDGVDTIGLYNPSTGAFFLRNANSAGGADVVFTFGAGGQGYIPVAGDWNDDGTDTVGLYSPATGAFFLKNTNANGGGDVVFTFGAGGQGYVPIAGDWNNDGSGSVGLYSPTTGAFFLMNANANGAADYVFGYGPTGATPLAGNWDGN